jgi:hypothetical protein
MKAPGKAAESAAIETSSCCGTARLESATESIGLHHVVKDE